MLTVRVSNWPGLTVIRSGVRVTVGVLPPWWQPLQPSVGAPFLCASARAGRHKAASAHSSAARRCGAGRRTKGGRRAGKVVGVVSSFIEVALSARGASHYLAWPGALLPHHSVARTARGDHTEYVCAKAPHRSICRTFAETRCFLGRGVNGRRTYTSTAPEIACNAGMRKPSG